MLLASGLPMDVAGGIHAGDYMVKPPGAISTWLADEITPGLSTR